MTKKIIYLILLGTSIILLPYLYEKIDQCEEESYGYFGPNNILELLILSSLYILVEVIIFSIDNLILLTKKIMKKEVNDSELYCFIGAIVMFILWLLIIGQYNRNGTCDRIIGPADTGLFLAVLITAIINFWKVIIIKIDNKNKI